MENRGFTEISENANYNFLMELEDGNLLLRLFRLHSNPPDGYAEIINVYYAEPYSELILIT